VHHALNFAAEERVGEGPLRCARCVKAGLQFVRDVERQCGDVLLELLELRCPNDYGRDSRPVCNRLERIRAAKGRVSGLLRLNVPRIALPIIMTPVVREMAKRFADVTVEIYADDAIADIVADGFDAGIRLGEMIAEDMITVRLTQPLRAIIVASPAYLSDRGRPKDVADLKNHNCIGYRLIRSGALYRWDLLDDGREVAIESSGSIVVNDALYARQLALAGVGLAYQFEPLVRADIAAGRLTEVLPKSAIKIPGLFLYYPRRASMAPKLKAFIDTTKEVLRQSRR
jgi:DNA-binding transcriptional LysR family regulator